MNNLAQQPLLRPVPPEGEDARVEAIFNLIEENLGMVPDGLRLYGMSPALLESFMGVIGYFMQHSRLSQPLLGFVRYLASDRIGCKFCIELNEGFLINLGFDIDTIRTVRDDIDRAPLSEAEKQLLAIAVMGVTKPGAVSSDDLDLARAEGWSDHDIFEVVAMAANTRAFNLVLKTFKVEGLGAFA